MAHRVLLITGGGYHDFAQGAVILTQALNDAGIEVTHTEDPASVSKLASGQFDCFLVYTQGDKFNDAQIDDISRFVKNGGGLVGIHCAADTNRKPGGAFGKLIGSAFVTHGPVFDFQVAVSDPDHPIAHRIQPFRITDELYILEPLSDFRTFLTAYANGKPQPVAYSKNEGKGRVVYLANGHWPKSLSVKPWQQILNRSIRYAAGEDWSKKTVKVAAIGYGGAFNMGKMHLESCQKSGMIPVAVSDLDPKRTAIAKTDFGDAMQTFNKVEDLLAKSDAEMCIIITPHNTHAPLSIQCLEAGRHVVTEKPYTITVDEATRVIETARKHKKMATVFHNRRWDADFLTIKHVIDSGAIGDVFQVEAFSGHYGEPSPGWWRSYKDVSGGAMYDWGAHFVDWILQMIPHKIESISGHFPPKKMWHQVTNEDHTVAFVKFEGGRSAHFESSNLAAIGKSKFRILGTHGGIEAGGNWPEKDTIRVVTHKDGLRSESKVPFMNGDWNSFYRNVADHLILGEPLAVTPESARKVIAVISLSEQSSKQGGAPVAVPFEQ